MGAITNWRTTLAGLVAGGLYVFSASYHGGMTFKDWAIAAGPVFIGILAKDFNVTGGSVPATPEATNRVKC